MDPKVLLKDEKRFKEFAKKVFDSFDINKNWEIDREELKHALISSAKDAGAPSPDDGVVNETMKELDKNNSSTLSIEEFESYVRTLLISMTS